MLSTIEEWGYPAEVILKNTMIMSKAIQSQCLHSVETDLLVSLVYLLG